MSYILDALKKAERERSRGQAPSLQNAPPLLSEPPRRRLWPWLLAGVLLANGGGLALLYQNQQMVSLQQSEVSVAKPTPIPIEPPEPPQPVLTESTLPEPVIELPKQAIALAKPIIPDPPLLPLPEPTPTPSVVIADQPLTAAAPPLLRTLPSAIRQSLPNLNLDIHFYDDLPNKRFVVINSRRYVQGDWLSEGALVETIIETGVIMRYGEQRFSLPALP